MDALISDHKTAIKNYSTDFTASEAVGQYVTEDPVISVSSR